MAKSYATPTTGFIDNGGVVQLGADNAAEQWDYITIPMPSQPLRIMVEGALPTDKDGVSVSVSFFEGAIPLFSASGTWGTQGQSSATASKKNWKFKLRNAVTGNKLSVKIGGWPAMTSITCKAYDTDRTLMRDSMTTELWRGMHRFPSGFLAPLSAYQYFDPTDCGVHQEALFSTAGTPAEIWQNGEFLGVYVIRADNDPPAYLMDDSNLQHILIQPQHAGNMWSGNFDSTVWDFPSPSVKGYDTGDDMSKLNTTVNSSTARLLNWMVACCTGKADFRSTYKQYLDLTSALDFILITEWSLSFDSLNNNFMLGSWDATPTSGIWHFWPYDEDETFGIAWFLSASGAIDPTFGWVTDDASVNKVPGGQPPGIFKVIREQMRPELRARWRALRDSGAISDDAVSRFITAYGAKISPDALAQDLINWPMTGWTGNQQGAIKIAQSVSYLAQIAHDRMAWIDAQWGYSSS
ncbi:CotH kinase family protein [Acetobacter persici]|uniref:CotH kinase family protein n=1 Tax=Acetobacter persici TaxID=1076596 RepID=UPI0039EC5A63